MSHVDLLSESDLAYCFEYGQQAREHFAGQTWESIEPRIRQSWENSHPHVAWEAARGRIEAEWRRHGRRSAEDL